MKTKFILHLLAIICIFLTGCTSTNIDSENSDVKTQPSPPNNEDSGYPVNNNENNNNSGYPIVESEDDLPLGPIFSINEPVEGGDTIVSGIGPAGVPIRLVDVSEVGLILGETIIDKNGTFSFTIEIPLESGHSIGLKLGDLTGTDFNENSFVNNETYYVRPLIGILFDMIAVK